MWLPKTESDLRLAIAEGSIGENQHLDAKRQSGDTNSAKAETAKDIASFALNGGALIVGVAENKSERTFELAPQPLEGLSEKLEQIATNRIDPPVFIRVTDIPTDDNPDLGYVFVEIPPSPTAPHMVDGRYYARGDRTTRRLTDAEVVQFHSRREAQESRIEALLAEEVSRDPYPRSTGNGHFFVVAEPLQARGDILVPYLRGKDISKMFDLLQRGNRGLPSDMAQFAPTLSSVHYWPTRARGVGATSFEGGSRVQAKKQPENHAIDIELQEHGGVRVFCGRMTQQWTSNGVEAICDALALAYAVRAVRWAGLLAEVSGHRGPWGFGIHCTGLKNLTSAKHIEDWTDRAYAYDRDTYEGITTASLAEIEDNTGQVVDRLVGQLLRGLATNHLYEDLLATI